jgi:hypothetical protein
MSCLSPTYVSNKVASIHFNLKKVLSFKLRVTTNTPEIEVENKFFKNDFKISDKNLPLADFYRLKGNILG